MLAIRQVIDIKNRNIAFTLPKSFNFKKAEVIVFPFDNTTDSPHVKRNIKSLLSVSVWGKNDISNLRLAQKRFKRWKLKEF
ncbi:MAG: hypothetical protein WAX69_23980 [Victivallales bacterium]